MLNGTDPGAEVVGVRYSMGILMDKEKVFKWIVADVLWSLRWRRRR